MGFRSRISPRRESVRPAAAPAPASALASALASAVALVAILAAPAPARAAPLTFGYVPTDMAYPFNAATARGFQDAARAAGVKTVVLDPKGDVGRQGNDLDDLVAQHVDAIGFLPLDSVVAESFVDRLNRAGVPVVAVGQQVGDAASRPLRDVFPGLSALVAPDDVVQGEQAGRLALGLLPANRPAKIAIVEGAPGYTIVRQFEEGFRKALDAAGAHYAIVAAQPTDWTPEKGETVCQNMLAGSPDLDLIFSEADDMAVGCARAIAAAQSHAHLIATGGGSRVGNAAIAAGELDGSVCIRPETLGRLMFKAMQDAVASPAAPGRRYVGLETPTITRQTLAACPAEW